MALRWCVLLAVVGYALAQSGDDLPMRYMDQSAVDLRSLHFYCEDVNMNEEDFNQLDNRADREMTWSMLIQFPVLAYLDSARKGVLVRSILNITNAEDTSLGLTSDQICIGSVVQYEVSFYRESVLVNFYFRDPTRNAAQVETINDAFKEGYNRASTDDLPNERDNNIVVPFLNRNAIVVNPEESLNQIEMNTHPGNTLLDDNENPTLRAVVINSVAGSVFEDREELTSDELINELISGNFIQVEGEGANAITRIVRQPPLNRFADNPNPRSLFLEAGDIVFIVFGVFFLFLLVLLILTGFCIHPFFLA